MTTISKVPEKHDPFSIFEMESSDYIDQRIPSVLLNTSKSILTSNPIVKAESIVNGPLTALIMAGMWGFIYAIQKRMLSIFINDVVNFAIHKDKIRQITADFSCIAYSTAVSKALHNDEKRAGGTIWGAIWKKISGGESIIESIENERRKIYELIPPMTASIVHVFLLNLKLCKNSFSDKKCKDLLKEFDFSSFDKIKKPFDENLEFIGGRAMPTLLIESRKALQTHLSYLKKLSCGDYFVDGMDHYEKKSSTVPEGYLYGEF